MNHQEPIHARRRMPLVSALFTAVFLLSAIGVIVLAAPLYPARTTADLDAVTSDFDVQGFDGWEMYVGEDEEPLEWRQAEGNGHLYGRPTGDARTSYYLAPPKFVDRDIWLRGEDHVLSFDIRWGGDGAVYYETGYESYGDVVVGRRNGPGEPYEACMFHSWTKADLPKGEWRLVELPLWEESAWSICPGTAGFDDVLGGLINTIEIRAEYGVFTDWSTLDNVELVFEAAPILAPRAPIVKVNDSEITAPTQLEDFDTLVMEVENLIFPPLDEPPAATILCGFDEDEATAVVALSGFTFHELGELTDEAQAVLLAEWTRVCGDDAGQRAPVHRLLPLTLESGVVRFPSRSDNLSLAVEAGQMTVEIGPAANVVVGYNPDESAGVVAATGGTATVRLPGSQTPITVEQGEQLTLSPDGATSLEALPQLFLPVLR